MRTLRWLIVGLIGAGILVAGVMLWERSEPVPAYARGMELFKEQRLEEAQVAFREAVQVDPELADGWEMLGHVYARQDQTDPAGDCFKKAEELFRASGDELGLAGALRGLAFVHMETGQCAEAIREFEECLAIWRRLGNDVLVAMALNNIAWMLSTSPDDEVRDGARAVPMAVEAVELATKSRNMETVASYTDTLAASYAETGDFGRAVEFQVEALRIANVVQTQSEEMTERVHLYRRGQKYRE